MSRDFDVIVAGVGAMGSSTCFELARRGLKVLGLEQFGIPHELGSSGGLSRMIRLAYYEHPNYVPILRRAYERWFELERLSGEKLIHITGGLFLGEPNDEMIVGTLDSVREHHLDHEVLMREQTASRFPQFTLPKNHIAIVEPNAGFLIPELVIATYARLAIASGAEVHTHEPIRSWRSDGDSVSVATDSETYTAKKLIFCGGAWSGKLINDLGVDLRPTRQLLGWVEPKQREQFALGRFPVWGFGLKASGLLYGFPMQNNEPGLKFALHHPGEVIDPDAMDRNASRDEFMPLLSLLEQVLPDAVGPIMQVKTCMYPMSPDGHFIIDQHPDMANVWIACGFSGHGFKFASVIGEILSDLAMHGKTPLLAGFLSLSRFGNKPAA